MGFIEGEARNQGTLFPVLLDDLIPGDHVCRVIEAFVNRLNMEAIGFVRAEPAETGRPGYDPRDLLKLYLYGYLQQIRSSRRLEAWMQAQCGTDVALGTAGAGPQEHRRVSASASDGSDGSGSRTGAVGARGGIGPRGMGSH